MAVPEHLEIKPCRYGNGLFTKINFSKGQTVFIFKGKTGNDSQTGPFALQIEEDLFLDSTIEYDDFLNHSCQPNCAIIAKENCISLVAIHSISSGQELTYNYNTTEYDMVNSVTPSFFQCKCGAKECVGVIKGYKFLTHKQKEKIHHHLLPFLQNALSMNLSGN